MAASLVGWFACSEGATEPGPPLSALVLTILRKILGRGGAPPIDPDAEERLLSLTGFADRASKVPFKGDVALHLDNGPKLEQLEAALRRTDPRFRPDPRLPFGSEAERRFIEDWVPRALGPQAGRWFLPQASLDLLLRGVGGDAAGDRRVDFLVVAPWLDPFVVEIDGDSYHVAAVDAERDRALVDAGYEVLRVPAHELEPGRGPGLQKIADRWLTSSIEEDQDILALALVPVLLHQFAEAILWAMELGLLRGEHWVVQVSDPFGHVADLFAPAYLDLFSAVDEIWGGGIMPARVDLVGTTDASFRRDGARYRRVGQADEAAEPDVVVRLEPYLRPTDPLERLHPAPEIVVRPTWLPFRLAPPRFDESSRVRLERGRDVREPLQILLRSLFAKGAFWPGQYEAIVQLLSGGDCAVLLPTGAGKSLIYQLAGLCMPGRTLIVDPTIALMEDQVERLRANGIDRVAGISSHEIRAGRGEQLLEQVMSGDALYVFISPERLQQDGFRNALGGLAVGHHVNLVAIDEAHCVSEWGHDFRPAYLGLGDSLRRFCKDAGGSPPPLLALTGTASRTVLLDVLVELGIDPSDEHALIRPESFDRKELEFQVWITDPAREEGTLRGVIQKLPTAFRAPPERFFRPAGRATACGIIFCPHVNGPHGIVEVSNKLQGVLGFRPPIFAGGTPRGFDERRFAYEKRENARRFRANEVAVLVATKAFGMGIDKPNVRWVVHYGIPPSMEAYYQEVGRAGRDGDRSVCWLILSDFDPDRSRRLIDTSANFEDARAEWEAAAKQAEDDVTRQLWFLYQAFPGQEEELDRLLRMVREIGPLGHAREVRIPMDKDDRARDRERALYRLKVLGAISDYSVDWGARVYTVRLAEAGPHDLPRALVAIRRTNRPCSCGRAPRRPRSSGPLGSRRSGGGLRRGAAPVRVRAHRRFPAAVAP